MTQPSSSPLLFRDSGLLLSHVHSSQSFVAAISHASPPPNHHPTRQVIFQGFLKKKNQDVNKEKSLEAHSQDDQTYLFVFFLQDVEEEAVRAVMHKNVSEEEFF